METTEVQDRLVYCYPVRLSIPSPPQPRVELHFENDIACLRYKGEMVKVNRGHFNKLVCTTRSNRTHEHKSSISDRLLIKNVHSLMFYKIILSMICPMNEWISHLMFLHFFPTQELLYRYSCIDDPRFEKFLSRVWCLIKRYQVNLIVCNRSETSHYNC